MSPSTTALPAAFLVACLPVFLLTGAPAGPAASTLDGKERQRRLAEIRAGIDRTVNDLERQLAKPNQVITTRNLPNAALFLLQSGQEAARAERLLRRMFAEQDMAPDSPGYGSFPWSIGNRDIQDENAVQLGLQALGPILLGHGDRLSPEFKRELVPSGLACCCGPVPVPTTRPSRRCCGRRPRPASRKSPGRGRGRCASPPVR